MPKFTLDEFLSDPKHKENRDFLSGAIDARIKEVIEQRRKKKKEKDAEEEDGNSASSGSFFDEIFGGKDE